MNADLLRADGRGLHCEAAGFHIDPWKPVDAAVVTHAHGDHVARECGQYLCAEPGLAVLRQRLGSEAVIETLPYGETRDIDGVRVSFHPAGHILGSAQVRVERRGHVWCVSGDYKLEPDSTCAPFEPVRCHTFVTESTFGLPIYRWEPSVHVLGEINDWWAENAAAERASVVFVYALGKAQRVLAGLDSSIGPIACHGAVHVVNELYRASGVELPPAVRVSQDKKKRDWAGSLILSPMSAQGTRWMRRFGEAGTAFASGWMRVRGRRRRRAVDRGFALSDHADWPGLLAAIEQTGAERILATHGSTAALVRWLREHGWQADSLGTRYQGELSDEEPMESAEAEGGDASEGDA